MSTQANDARQLVDGIIEYVKSEGSNAAQVPKVEKLFHKIAENDRKHRSARVTTTHPLSADKKEAMKNTLELLVDHTLNLEYVLDERLIAGMRIQIGDFIIDTSFANQLDRMGKSLIQ